MFNFKLPTNFGRSYEPRTSRQQDADRIVYTEEEFRRLLAAVSTNQYGQLSTIRLGDNIQLSSPIKLSNAIYNITVVGGGRFKIRAPTSSINSFFNIADDYTVSNITFDGVTFEGRVDSTNFGSILFDADGYGVVLDNVNLSDCNFRYTYKLFSADFSPDYALWRNSSLENITADNSTNSSAADTIIGACDLLNCNITNTRLKTTLDDNLKIEADPQSNSYENIFINTAATPTDSFPGLTTQSITSDLTLNVKGALVLSPATSTLSGSNPILFINNSFVRITLTNTASGNIVLGSGTYTGRRLTLFFESVDGASTAQLTTGAGNFRGAGNFVPTNMDVIELIFIGSTWYEVSRSVNA